MATGLSKNTAERFTTLSIDQAHQQNNKLVKGVGGGAENEVGFRKWTVAEAELARILTEVWEQYTNSLNDNQYHHEEGLSAQKTFQKQAMELVKVISEMGNPFNNNILELLSLDTRNVFDNTVVNIVRTIETVRNKKCENYKKSVLTDATHSMHDPIKKNKLPLFGSPAPKTRSKQVEQASLPFSFPLFSVHRSALTTDRLRFLSFLAFIPVREPLLVSCPLTGPHHYHLSFLISIFSSFMVLRLTSSATRQRKQQHCSGPDVKG